MIKTFTQNDVIRYYYNETSLSEKREIEVALLKDDSLSDFYFGLIEMESALNKISKEPSQKCIDNILNYSGSFSAHSV